MMLLQLFAPVHSGVHADFPVRLSGEIWLCRGTSEDGKGVLLKHTSTEASFESLLAFLTHLLFQESYSKIPWM
ncbi:hypothetical protein VNO77_23124 [Canavalia gladiata]|uniref:Uncharacterized protein n=1 Tax=Canavalia gladiata TaxID=3824 RepID=A0AAN9QBG0_CANGL